MFCRSAFASRVLHDARIAVEEALRVGGVLIEAAAY